MFRNHKPIDPWKVASLASIAHCTTLIVIVFVTLDLCSKEVAKRKKSATLH